MLFEVCIDSVEGALAAQQGGAHRVELCANLVEGGVTPSAGMLTMVRQWCDLRMHVLIRPRGGDFLYSDHEFEVMKADIAAAKQAGADGVVIGLLLPDGRVDAPRTAELVNLARPMAVTFHRAIDVCRDPAEALDTIAGLRIDSVLTSGQQGNAWDGKNCISRLVAQADGRLQVMAGGGVNAGNVRALVEATGVKEVHFSAREATPSPMQFQRPGVAMGKAYTPDEYMLKTPRTDLVRAVIAAALNN